MSDPGAGYLGMSNEDLARELIRHDAPMPGDMSAIRCVRSLDWAVELLPNRYWRIDHNMTSIIIVFTDLDNSFRREFVKGDDWREKLAGYVIITWLEWDDQHK